MPTIVTSTIKSSGGDYTSLNAWEAAKQGDLVTADQVQKAECYAFDEGGGDIVVDGSTTDSTRYMWIFVPVAERHNRTAGTGFRKVATVSSNSYWIYLQDSFTRLEGISCDGSTRSVYGPRVGAADCRITHCLAFNFGTASNARGIWSDEAFSWKCWNCIVYDSGQTGSFAGGFYNGTTGTVHWANCTCSDCPESFRAQGGTVIARNCVSQNSTNGFTGTFDAASEYNLSELASDAPGTNALNSTTVTFVDETGNDFGLSDSDSTAKDSGKDLSSDADTAFSDDIIGVSRPQGSAWDRGASEVVAAAAGHPTMRRWGGVPQMAEHTGRRYW